MAADLRLALSIADPSAAPIAWPDLMPRVDLFWQLACGRSEPRHRAGRLKQWLNYPRRAHVEAVEAYATLRTINDPVEIRRWLAARRPHDPPPTSIREAA